MSDNVDGTSGARRRFLKHAALVVVGTSMADVSTTRHTARASERPQRECPDTKAPMKEVEGKVAFITGGSSGVGLGIARAFADAGMKAILGYRTKEHFDEAMKYLEGASDRVHAIEVDVTDRAGMEKASAEAVRVFEKVHVLVNNAGVVVPTPLSKTTYNDWDCVMNVNVNVVFNGVHTFLSHMQTHGEGGRVSGPIN